MFLNFLHKLQFVQLTMQTKQKHDNYLSTIVEDDRDMRVTSAFQNNESLDETADLLSFPAKQ